jgi:hypothetical protein
MLEFLTGPKIIEKINTEAAKAHQADLAVAFWGKGALRLLGFPKTTKLRILCDLDSGACNPHELIKCLKRGNVEIRAQRKFHAKVYLMPACAIVASANASAHGLGDEGDEETKGTVEAGIFSDNKKFVDDVKAWFKAQWEDAHDDVDEERARRAILPWELRRKAQKRIERLTQRMTIGRQYTDNREWFNQRRIWLISSENETPSDDAIKGFHSIKSKFFDQRELRKIGKLMADESFPFYELEKSAQLDAYRPSDFILSFVWEKSRRPEFDGIWQIDRQAVSVPISDATKLVLVHPRDRAAGLNFPKREQDAVRNWLDKHNKDRNFSKMLSQLPKTFSFSA